MYNATATIKGVKVFGMYGNSGCPETTHSICGACVFNNFIIIETKELKIKNKKKKSLFRNYKSKL